MLVELLPDGVVAVERFDDDEPAPLYPEEEQAVARAVDKRRREFATVRLCARRALVELGLPPAPILPGTRGAPGWPPGVVGSMTHCAGYRAAALAHATTITAVGIDAEPHADLPEGVFDTIALPREQEQLAQLRGAVPEVCWDRLLFSAKESVYKVWFPLAQRWLGFEDAELTLSPDGRFQARLLVAGPQVRGEQLTTLSGRWLVENGLLVTAIVLPTDGTT